MISAISAFDRPQQRRLGGHGDRVGELADLQRDRQLDLLADSQREPLLRELPKPGEFGREGVLADRQRGQEEPAGASETRSTLKPLARCVAATLTPGSDAALRILDDAADLGGVVLGQARSAPRGRAHRWSTTL